MNVCLTVDVEVDCPPYLSSWRGVDEGLPWLCEALAAVEIPATFFVTGDAARRRPLLADAIDSQGHELGCHGDTHADFTRLDRDAARADIRAALSALDDRRRVKAFRAPFLRFPDRHLDLLEEAGFDLDSSCARYKQFGVGLHRRGALTRVPVSITSSLLRLPAWCRDRWLTRLAPPIVLFVHPWEFVDYRRAPVRLDCRFRTGRMACESLVSAIQALRDCGARFRRLGDIIAETGASPPPPEPVSRHGYQCL